MLRYYNFNSFGFANPLPIYREILVHEPPYIKIRNFKVYPNDKEFLSSFSFIINKRGGDTSKIKFATKNIPITLGDNIEFYVQDRLVYTGYIEQDSIQNESYELTIVPTWSRLRYSIVSGGIVLETEIAIIDLVRSLFPYIIEQGIGISENRVIIPRELTIRTSSMGKNIVEILDECEDSLPAGYCWGVINNVFFFNLQNEVPNKVLNWRTNDFSDSTVAEDFSNIFTQTSVFVKEKDGDGNEVVRSLGIVGNGGDYPPLPFSSKVAIKMNKYEFPFEIPKKEALDYAYHLLLNQFTPINIKIKDFNVNNKVVNILDPICVYSKPVRNLSKYFSKVNSEIQNELFNSVGGYIQRTNDPLGTFTFFDDNKVFDFSSNREYIEYCNSCENIELVNIEYESEINEIIFTVTDGNTSINVAGSFGFAKINLTRYNFNKRKLRVVCTSESSQFYYKFIYITFSHAQFISIGNVRKITYKMDNKFNISVDLEIAKIGTVLNGYLFRENKKMERLSTILSLSEV
ncbi:MAG: hypothetical protein ACRC0A_01580 [Chitinophagaceae bacterium]